MNSSPIFAVFSHSSIFQEMIEVMGDVRDFPGVEKGPECSCSVESHSSRRDREELNPVAILAKSSGESTTGGWWNESLPLWHMRNVAEGTDQNTTSLCHSISVTVPLTSGSQPSLDDREFHGHSNKPRGTYSFSSLSKVRSLIESCICPLQNPFH